MGEVVKPADRPFGHYRCWVFDCDGVLLDSNRVKTEAFHAAALPYGENVADQLVDFHVKNGGVSRFKKVDYLFEVLLKREAEDGEKQAVLDRFAAGIEHGLLNCQEAPGLRDALDALPGETPKYVVSGGEQSELRKVFEARGLAKYFTGIFGSPDNKELILEREFASGAMAHPALFIGDSEYDFVAADASGMDFVFLTRWTEFKDWEQFFQGKDVSIAKDISFLFNMA